MNQLAGPALESALLRAGDQVGDAVTARLDRLDLITRLMVNDPPFRAYAAEGHLPSLADNLQDRRALYALDGFLLADDRGSTLVDTRAPPGPGGAPPTRAPGTPSGAPQSILAEALAGRPARGLWIERDGALFLAAAAPLPAGGVAAIVALESVGGALVGAWRRTTGAELVFFSGGSGAARRIVPGASTLPLSRSELARLLESDALAAGEAPQRIDADGEEFVARSTVLSAEGEPAAGFVALRSVDRELAAFRKIQTALLALGLAAIPLTLVLGALLGRRVTRPIATLVRATERVRAGDYDAPLPPETPDELGALAGAFRTLVAQLKQKEEMDAWIGALVARVAGARVQDLPTVPERAPEYGPGTGRATDSDVTTRSVAGPAPRAGREGSRPIEAGMLLQDRFRVLARLGAGGMGEVWKVRDERLGEVIALKFLPAKVMADQPERVERFRQEIRLARRITHRNVVRTHELLELPDGWALLMEHVDGVPLQRLLTAGRLPAAAGLRIARQICDGLEAAHGQGVIHRDLKPGNVLIDSTGGVKIADFGLARAADAGDGPTLQGSLLGTPHYMSPEQVRGRPVDRRADIYSAGVMFYELLCGRLPFEGESALALLRAHADAAPPAPRSINPAIGADLEVVLLRALEKDPAQRYASARELSEALGQAFESGAAA
jgi:serine/threonine-protein kinase